MKPLIIAQAPGPRGVGRRPLDGPGSGTRLAALAGLSLGELLERVAVVNLFDAYPGPAGRKGDRFPVRAARERAAALWPRVRRRARVLFLGARVVEAFGISPTLYPACAWWLHPDGFEFGWLPHPSGVNLWYNDRANRLRAERFLRDLFRPIGRQRWQTMRRRSRATA